MDLMACASAFVRAGDGMSRCRSDTGEAAAVCGCDASEGRVSVAGNDETVAVATVAAWSSTGRGAKPRTLSPCVWI